MLLELGRLQVPGVNDIAIRAFFHCFDHWVNQMHFSSHYEPTPVLIPRPLR